MQNSANSPTEQYQELFELITRRGTNRRFRNALPDLKSAHDLATQLNTSTEDLLSELIEHVRRYVSPDIEQHLMTMQFQHELSLQEEAELDRAAHALLRLR